MLFVCILQNCWRELSKWMVTCHPALGMAPSVLQSASLLLILLSYEALIKHEGWGWLHCTWKFMQYNYPGWEISLFCFQFLQENKHFAPTEFTICGFQFGFTIPSRCHAPSKILAKSKGTIPKNSLGIFLWSRPRECSNRSLQPNPESWILSTQTSTGQELGLKGSTWFHLGRVKRSPESFQTSWTSLKSHQ